MLVSALVYAGLLTAFIGAVSVLKPLGFLRIRTRRTAALVLALGLVVVFVGWSLPARELRVASPSTQLDRYMPAYQFHERHSIRVSASPRTVDSAIRAVTADEIEFFRLLTWIPRMGRPGPESIMNPPEGVPLMEVATRTSFLLLADEPDREIVIGTAVVAPSGWQPKGRPTPEGFRRLHEPGFVLAAMNFRIEGDDQGSTVTTETRVYATDDPMCRAFAPYWRTIYPGSALIRHMWLKAIRRRAES